MRKMSSTMSYDESVFDSQADSAAMLRTDEASYLFEDPSQRGEERRLGIGKAPAVGPTADKLEKSIG